MIFQNQFLNNILPVVNSEIAIDNRLSIATSNFILKCFKSSYFPNQMIDLVHIWNDNRCRSKVLFIITPTYVYDLKVKVTDLEVL